MVWKRAAGFPVKWGQMLAYNVPSYEKVGRLDLAPQSGGYGEWRLPGAI